MYAFIVQTQCKIYTVQEETPTGENTNLEKQPAPGQTHAAFAGGNGVEIIGQNQFQIRHF